MKKNIYFYSNLFAWGLILLVVGNYVLGWTTPTQDPPGGNVILEHGLSPAGSTGHIQFNDDGNLGADPDLFWDNTNKRLGIGTTSPGAILHVSGNIIANAPAADSHVATKGYVDASSGNTAIYTYAYLCSSCGARSNSSSLTCDAALPAIPACPAGYTFLMNVTNSNMVSALSTGLPIGRTGHLSHAVRNENKNASCNVSFEWPPGFSRDFASLTNVIGAYNCYSYCNIVCHVSFCVKN